MASSSKRWLWIVNVVAIVIGAWLVAGTVNAMVASTLSAADAAPAKKGGRTVAVAPAAAGMKPLDAYLTSIKSKNVFNHGEPIPDEQIVGGPAVPSDAPPDACTVPVQVLSTVIASNAPHLSVATVMDNSLDPPGIRAMQVGERVAEQAMLVSVGEEFLDDGTLTSVSVIELLRDDGRKEICRSDAPAAPVRVASAGPAMPAAGGKPAVGEGIKKLSDTQFEVAQSEIDAVMNGGMATMAQDVRIVPYFEGGAPKGFKLYSIKPGSLLSKIGLMNGDVIQKVNGYDISSPEKALQVYGLLKNEKNVAVDLTRNGQNKSISYTVR